MNNTCRICNRFNVKEIDVTAASYTVCSECHSICKVITLDEYNALTPDYGSGDMFKELDISFIKSTLSIDLKKKFISSILRNMEWGPDYNLNELRFLDIGCGMGGYLIAANELGMNSCGIEPSKDHYEVTRDMFDLNIVNGYLTENTFPNQKFDIIILSHVIEHIYQPKEFIVMAMNLLSSKGILVITTPNANSFLSNVAGKYWAMLKPVDHVSLLSIKSFQAMGLNVAAETSEYPWEFSAGLASIMRQSLKFLHRSEAGTVTYTQGVSKTMSMRNTRKDRLLKLLLTITSLPFYIWATLLDKRSCLIIKMRKQPIDD